MGKRTNTQPAASVIAFAGTLSVARASQLAAIESWADVYEAAAFMLMEVPSRDLAKQLEAAGATCNKDTAGFYADAAVWAPFMRTDGEVDSLFMRAAVKADQAATLLPHECVSYGRNRAGLTIEEVRQVMSDAVAELKPEDVSKGTEADEAIKVLSKAIRTLRTPAKKSRNQNQNQDQGDQGDQGDQNQDHGDQDQETDGDTVEVTPTTGAYVQAIIGPMTALTRLIQAGSTLTATERDTLNAHWAELIKAVRATEVAA